MTDFDAISHIPENEREIFWREQLERVFGGFPRGPISYSAINVNYYSKGDLRHVAGVPYDIVQNELVIGPYFKNPFTSIPPDYHEREQNIPLKDITGFNELPLVALVKNSVTIVDLLDSVKVKA